MNRDESGKPSWIKSAKERIMVTPREYSDVAHGLRLPEDYFTPGMQVLSVGEGFSDFARKLHDEKGVGVYSLDPIYRLGKSILNKDPNQVQKAIQEAYGRHIRFEYFNRPELPLPDPKRIVAGSIYNLPFKDRSFDRIVSYSVLDHLDLAEALPEVARVLRPGGEARFAGTALGGLGDFIPTDREGHPTVRNTKKLLHNHIEIETVRRGFEYNIELMPGLGNLGGGMQWLRQHPELSAYVFFGSIDSKDPLLTIYGNYFIDQLIIRNDDKWPIVTPYDLTNLADLRVMMNYFGIPWENTAIKEISNKLLRSPDIGQIYKVNPVLHQDQKDWPVDYYPLIPKK